MDERRILGFYTVDLFDAAPGTVSQELTSLPASLSSLGITFSAISTPSSKPDSGLLLPNVVAQARAITRPFVRRSVAENIKELVRFLNAAAILRSPGTHRA
jgi:hypothetical protein